MKHAALTFLSLLACSACVSADDAKPNILMIAVDDLNDWIGPNGQDGNSQAITPNLDRLVKRGVYFTNAHTAVPVCMASRLALMSGLSASTTGHYANHKIVEESPLRQTAMLPAYVRQHGYKTLGGGKLYHDGTESKTESADWDAVKPMYEMSKEWRERGHNYGHNFFQPFPKGGSQIVRQHGKVPGFSLCGGPLDREDMPRGIMPDEELADWAVGQLKQTHEKPFFLAVGFARPHVPYTAPRKYFDLYDAASLKIPFVPDDEFNDIPLMGKVMAMCMLPGGDHRFVTTQMGPGYWRELVHAYLACVSFADDQIGRVLKALDDGPHAKNTLIVLWSDHGQHLGEKKHWRKQCLWEESTRVPLIWVLPDGRNAGARCVRPASLLDVYPTIVDLAELPPIQSHEGLSLVPWLNDPAATRERPAVTTWHFNNHSVRSERYHYIRYRDGSEELYDHAADPGEHTNLAPRPAMAEILAEHRRWLPTTNVNHSEDPLVDSCGKQYQQWAEAEGDIPEWLR
jgi:iduronate 2-sulfatase